MVSAPKQTVAVPPPPLPVEVPWPVSASLSARIAAYVVDSVILLAFVLVFFVLAGLQLLLASDWGETDPSDAAIVAFISIFAGGTVLAWSAFNVALLRWRGQTTGMYVLGIRAVREDGAPITGGQALLRWCALHPLLLHPFVLPLWAILMLLSIDFALSRGGIVMVIAVFLLAAASPIVNLALVVFGDGRRTLQDRITRTSVVHIEAP